MASTCGILYWSRSDTSEVVLETNKGVAFRARKPINEHKPHFVSVVWVIQKSCLSVRLSITPQKYTIPVIHGICVKRLLLKIRGVKSADGPVSSALGQADTFLYRWPMKIPFNASVVRFLLSTGAIPGWNLSSFANSSLSFLFKLCGSCKSNTAYGSRSIISPISISF